MKTNKSGNNYSNYEKLSQNPPNEKNSFQLNSEESIGVRHFFCYTKNLGFFSIFYNLHD